MSVQSNNKNERNSLYPVFFKLHKLRVLIVGAGEVGYEKLSFILKSSPDANITIIAPEVNPDIRQLLHSGQFKVSVIKRKFKPSDLNRHDFVIAATNIPKLNRGVWQLAKAKSILINVADTPALCDFYLGSIVTRGHLKIAISTNGKSPTFAKRFRQLLEEVLPEDTAELLLNLKSFRDRLNGNFADKVKKLNALTEGLLLKSN